MGKILVFEGIEKIALKPGIEGLILFGERDYINDGNNVYDLIFHSKSKIDINEKENTTSLVIPVLKQEEDKDATISAIYFLNLNRPDFTRIGVSGDFLEFYDVVPKGNGKEVLHLGKYNTVLERKFMHYIDNRKLMRDIMEKRRILDRKY